MSKSSANSAARSSSRLLTKPPERLHEARTLDPDKDQQSLNLRNRMLSPQKLDRAIIKGLSGCGSVSRTRRCNLEHFCLQKAFESLAAVEVPNGPCIS